MRTTPDEYERVELRAHSLLSDVPLHDVWTVDLSGGGSGLSIVDIRDLLSVEDLASTNPAVRLLFQLRSWLGRRFGWDHEPANPSAKSFVHRLSDSEQMSSLVAPGTQEGPFQVLFVSPRESISEIRNATVHAFSVFALIEHSHGYRLYWAIYVRPVGRLTSWYMRLIDPFRRHIIYPAVLRHIRTRWERSVVGRPPGAQDGSESVTTLETSSRPWWMTAMAAFCLITVAFLVPRDLFFAQTRDVEVWFGFEVRGAAAMATAPVHWAIFLVGAWGFWFQRPWILPCAAGYAFYVSISHLIWSEVSPNGHGWPAGLLQALALSVPGFLLLRARRLTKPEVVPE